MSHVLSLHWTLGIKSPEILLIDHTSQMLQYPLISPGETPHGASDRLLPSHRLPAFRHRFSKRCLGWVPLGRVPPGGVYRLLQGSVAFTRLCFGWELLHETRSFRPLVIHSRVKSIQDHYSYQSHIMIISFIHLCAWESKINCNCETSLKLYEVWQPSEHWFHLVFRSLERVTGISFFSRNWYIYIYIDVDASAHGRSWQTFHGNFLSLEGKPNKHVNLAIFQACKQLAKN